MKTIFVTIYEGVEAKNLLRSPVVSDLLKDPDVRVVLLMKSRERRDFYEKEWNDPRIIYEVTEYPTASLGYLDAFFGWMRFFLLRTETTDLKRKLAWEEARSTTMRYYAGFLFNRIMARSFVCTCARFLDYHLVRAPLFASLFEKYKPDVVLCAHLFDGAEIHLLREARKRCVQTIGFVNSWDKTTARGVLRLLPEKMLVYNNIIKEELMRYHGVAEKNIVVIGIPQYDRYFRKQISSRDEFFERLHISPEKKLILYAPAGRAASSYDWDVIDLLHRLKEDGAFGSNVEFLIRFQPNDYIDTGELRKRPYLKYDYPGIRFSMTKGVDWDMSASDFDHLTNTLAHMSLLICYGSSMLVDASIFDKPVIVPNYEMRTSEKNLRRPTRYYGMTHFKRIIPTGGARFVGSTDELILWVRRYLADPSLDHEGRARLVKEQCVFMDGRSSERIAKEVLTMTGIK